MPVVKPIIHLAPARVACLSVGVVARTLLALVALGLLALPVLAQDTQRLRLRGDVTARGDVLTLGDLVEGASTDAARRGLFRAPALGASGTIQVRRIAEAVAALGLGEVETGGRVQVGVQRAARRIGAPEIELALKRVLESTYGLDPRNLAIRIDGEAPALLAPIDLDGPVAALDVAYDARLRRVAGLITLGERQASLRVTGQVVEIREVAILIRSLNRGEAVAPADLAIERRPREGTPADAQSGLASLPGQVAQRALSAGAVLRSGDLALPDLVIRGEAVTVVFDTPGLNLSLRAQANENGRLGAAITVTNPISKKTIAATVIGPGRVSVGPAPAPP
ncbi:MAG TPA: flagellar basal body P-ring formation chaperone FlgA, partial [Methylobacterium sp.]